MQDAPSISDLQQSLLSAVSWWADVGVETPAIAVPKKRAQPATRGSNAAANTPPPSRPQNTGSSALGGKPQRARPEPKPITRPNPPMQNANAAQILQERLQLARSIAQAAPTLEALKSAITEFDAGVLSANARQALFANRSGAANIMIIGETPTQNDDQAGHYFSAGQGVLLSKMFAAIDIKIDDIYITGVSPWVTPSERALDEDELDLCRVFLRRHIALVDPDLLILAGSTALQALCNTTSMMKSRGQWQEVKIGDKTIKAMPLYPPHLLLQRPSLKKQAWRDLLAIRAHQQIEN